MPDKPKNVPKPPRGKSSEYGDALTDVLKDQARRNELRRAAPSGRKKARLHPLIPPALALVSIWLWAVPPSILQPVAPSIPPANQEADLRMEMFIRSLEIQRYVAANGTLPPVAGGLDDIPDGVEYAPLGNGVYRLRGRTGDITVDYISTESTEQLLGNAQAIVSGLGGPSNGVGAAK